MARLRARVAALEQDGIAPAACREILSTGMAEIDRFLPRGGLPRGAVHEVAEDMGGEGAAPAAWIARMLAALSGPVLWCARKPDLYAPGLAWLGLDPGRLVMVRAARDRDLFWTLEEAGREPGFAAVVGEIPGIDLTASRRLQLVAGMSGTTIFLLHRPLGNRPGAQASAAMTRWRMTPQPSAVVAQKPGMAGPTLDELGAPRWRLELLRARGGRPGQWIVELDHETRRFHILPDLEHRPALWPASGRADEGHAAAAG